MTSRKFFGLISLLIIIFCFVSCKQETSIPCSLYFSANGAAGDVPQRIEGDSGTTITLPDKGDLNKDHCTFGGWNTSMSGTGRNYLEGDDYDLTFSTTLYARWDPVMVKLSFDPAGALGKPSDYTVAYGESVAVPDGQSMQYPHMDFKGWTDGTAVYTQGIAYQVLEDTTLTAIWEEHIYSLVFDANGGKITAQPMHVHYGDEVILPSSLPREGYKLSGWSYERGGAIITGSIQIEGDATLYACWESE